MKVNGVDYPAWGLYGSTGETNFVNDSINLPVSNFGNTGGPLTYSALNLPPGLSINPTTGVIAGTIAPQVFSTTTFDTRILATNGMFTVGLRFPWKVRYGITIDYPNPLVAVEGVPLAFGPVTATNRFSQPVTFSASGLPPGLSFDPATRMVTGTVAIGAAQNGPYLVTLNATDGIGSESTQFYWTVTGITLNAPSILANHYGDNINLPIHGTAASGSPIVFAAQGLPEGLSINPTTGLITGTIANPYNYDFATTHAVSLTATQGNDSLYQYFYWNVLPAGTTDVVHLADFGTQTSHEGDFVYLDLGPVSDLYLPVAFTASGLPPGLSISNSDFGRYIGGQLAVGSSATSPYNVHLSVTNGQTTDEVTFQWIVGPRPPELPGDFDGNGVVDQGDYSMWRGNFGESVTPYMSGDGNGDGEINSADYVVWRKQLGQSSGGSGGGGAIATGGGALAPSSELPEVVAGEQTYGPATDAARAYSFTAESTSAAAGRVEVATYQPNEAAMTAATPAIESPRTTHTATNSAGGSPPLWPANSADTPRLQARKHAATTSGSFNALLNDRGLLAWLALPHFRGLPLAENSWFAPQSSEDAAHRDGRKSILADEFFANLAHAHFLEL